MFASDVRSKLEPLFNGVYDDPVMIGEEIEQVATILQESAVRLLPIIQPKKGRKWRDDVLSGLCAKSRQAHAAWKSAGCPPAGLLYEEKNRLRCAVRKRIRWCAAKSERLRVQRRDRLFAHQDGRRFRTPQRKKSRCSKLIVGEEVVQDLERLLKVWANHFQVLAESNLSDGEGNSDEWVEKIKRLEALSYENEEYLLDVPFTSDEVARAVHKLKKKKAPGPDGLLVEHLKAGGDAVIIWLRNILNAVVELEVIPDVMKRGVVVPVYKGGGKDPLKIDSYRGITLTSMVAKVLEFLLLERLHCVFLEAGLPHINQTAYRRAVSCADAIFVTQELIAKYLKGGSRVFMCLYDMQKAFHSVEYAVLLEKLFEAGVNGKLWRMLKRAAVVN